MPTDKRVDEYIERSPEFAQPILRRLREMVHKGCPEAEEAIKWSTPSFLYRNKILFSMAAFKAHCRFIFWRPEIATMLGKNGTHSDDDGAVLGKITRLSDLPLQKDLLSYVRETCRLADEGPRTAMRKRPPAPKKQIEMPAAFAAALAKNKPAATAFENFSPSHRREYLEWIVEAKRSETRDRRVQTAIEWLAEGKPRNWKYTNC